MLNLQGDVIGIYDNTGTVVVKYAYDAWGKLISTTGSMASTIGIKNPIRYRGYYYDTETGLYYLQSRYYDPETCRFINADSLLMAGDSLQGTNMFAYCLNNPVMYVDPTGMASKSEIREWFGGLLTFSVLCDYFGFTNWIPGISDISGEIIGFEYSVLWEFNIDETVAHIINIANDAIIGSVIGSLVSTFLGSGTIVGIFTKSERIRKYVPKVLGGIAAVSESAISELLGSINIFSNVAPGKYALSSFLFMEEGRNHEYIPHIYYALIYLETDQKSSLEFLLYKVGF